MCDATSTQVKTQNKGCVLYKLQYVPVSCNTTTCNLYTNRHTVDYCMHTCMVFLADACFHYYVPKTKTQDTGPIHYSSQCALDSKKEHNKEVMMMRWNIGILYLRVPVWQIICFWRNSERSTESYCTVDCMWISCTVYIYWRVGVALFSQHLRALSSHSQIARFSHIGE